MKSYNEILINIMQGIEDWETLKLKLENYNTSQTETTRKKTSAGKIFEYFTKYYFLADPKVLVDYKKVYLYDEIPIDVCEKLNLPSVDHGVDLLLQHKNNEFHAVQCKFKNDELKKLSWTGDKIGNAFGSATLCERLIVFTNVSDVTGVIKGFDKYSQFSLSNLLEINSSVFRNILKLAKGEEPLMPLKFKPREHQLTAIDEVVRYFYKNDRGQLILPCGAGKTLTALWIKEKLRAEVTLVLVPSLALLKQIKNDWAEQFSLDYDYMCVCSEKDIDKDRSDTVKVNTYEIGGVSTDVKVISNFIRSKGRKVIFSTYQSLEVVQMACKEVERFKFDLTICDEAHRTTGGRNKNTFTLVHSDSNIPSQKRLYMTATPKVVSSSLKAKLGGDYELLCDMSNIEIYGGEAYRMTFGEAISKEILVDYKIIGIGVTDKQVQKFIERQNYIEDYSITDLAHNFALELVMNKYRALHGLSFHSRVKLAEDFSKRHNQFFSKVFSRHVEGKQSTSKRARILNEFKKSKKGVVSNARCLTEGVDVPSIDLIYFCDPKTSKIDIIQASGRALRKDPKGNKKLGYIVVPIFHHIEENLEKEIKRRPIFKHLIQIVRSLSDQDERLQAYINKVAFEKSKIVRSKNEISTNEIEKVIRLEGLEDKLKDVLFDEIINKTRSFWDVRFLQLVNFKKEYGHLDVSKTEFPKLNFWINEQRVNNRKNRISFEKKLKLVSIGFDWKSLVSRDVTDNDEIWWSSFDRLVDYYKQHGNSDVPAKYSKDKQLGTWVVAQRQKKRLGRLTQERIDLLDDLNFKWKGRGGVFEKYCTQLVQFKNKYGHTNVSTYSKDFSKLGKWTNRYRTILNNGVTLENGTVKHSAGKLTKNQIKKLFELGFQQKAGRLTWEDHYNELLLFYQENGHSSPKQSENFDLYHWCFRVRKSKLNQVKRNLLKKIEFNFDNSKLKKSSLKSDLNTKRENVWNQNFKSLEGYFLRFNTFHIPGSKTEFLKLRSWLQYQKILFKKGILKVEKVQRLESIGFSFDYNYTGRNYYDPISFENEWYKKCEELSDYFIKYQTFQIPKHFVEYKDLKAWLIEQKRLKKENRLDDSKIDALYKVGFSFDLDYRGKKISYGTKSTSIKIKRSSSSSNSKSWSKMYLKLADYKLIYGDCNVPRSYKDSSLANFVNSQRNLYRNGSLESDRVDKLKFLEFEFYLRRNTWNTQYLELKEFFNIHGHSRYRKTDENRSLYNWVLIQRGKKRKGVLSEEKIQKLNKIKFEWNPKSTGKPDDDKWFKMLLELKNYKEKFGDTNVSQVDPVYKKLGKWLNEQRLYKFGKKIRDKTYYLSEEREGLLADLGVIWNPRESLWGLRLGQLEKHFKKYGHFRINQKDKEFKVLYNWLYKIKKNGTSKVRIQDLKNIGFDIVDIKINED